VSVTVMFDPGIIVGTHPPMPETTPSTVVVAYPGAVTDSVQLLAPTEGASFNRNWQGGGARSGDEDEQSPPQGNDEMGPGSYVQWTTEKEGSQIGAPVITSTTVRIGGNDAMAPQSS